MIECPINEKEKEKEEKEEEEIQKAVLGDGFSPEEASYMSHMWENF